MREKLVCMDEDLESSPTDTVFFSRSALPKFKQANLRTFWNGYIIRVFAIKGTAGTAGFLCRPLASGRLSGRRFVRYKW